MGPLSKNDQIKELINRSYRTLRINSSYTYSFYDLSIELIREGSIKRDSQLIEKRDFITVEKITISSEFKPFLFSGKNILEIGAGKLDNNGKSYLMNLLPEEIAIKIKPTDFNKSYKKIKHTDVTKLTIDFAKESFDVIMGLSVIDTIQTKNLRTAVEKISFCLKKGGYFLHAMSLPPFEDTILDEYSKKEDQIWFPTYEEGSFKGVRTLEKNQFSAVLKKVKLSNRERVFFGDFLDYSSLERGNFFTQLDQDHLIKLDTLSRKIPGMQEVNNCQFFEGNIKKALSHQFEIIKMEYITKSKDILVDEGKGGYEIKMVHGKYSKNSNPSLASNSSKVTLETLVLVAKKKEQSPVGNYDGDLWKLFRFLGRSHER